MNWAAIHGSIDFTLPFKQMQKLLLVCGVGREEFRAVGAQLPPQGANGSRSEGDPLVDTSQRNLRRPEPLVGQQRAADSVEHGNDTCDECEYLEKGPIDSVWIASHNEHG